MNGLTVQQFNSLTIEARKNGANIIRGSDEIEKHLDDETKLPTSAKRPEEKTAEQVGEDANATATLPAWCKEGQWVFYDGYLLGKIEGFEKVSEDESAPPTICAVLIKSYGPNGELLVTRLPKQIIPVKFRPYTYDEAVKLVGKVMEMQNGDTRSSRLITVVSVPDGSTHASINGYSVEWLTNVSATIGGIPVGVPEVDEDALEGGTESNGLASCDTCKYVRWLGSSGMQVCEKRGNDSIFPYCYDCATEGGEE